MPAVESTYRTWPLCLLPRGHIHLSNSKSSSALSLLHLLHIHRTMVTITSSCHCKRFTYPFEVDETTLPLLDTTCNCTSCRRRTGQIAILPFPATSLPPKEYLGLLKGHTSRNEVTKTEVTSYFCEICGSKLFMGISDFEGNYTGGCWMLGCLDRVDGMIDVLGHKHLEDTIDGGVSEIWRSSKGKALDRFRGKDEAWEEPTESVRTTSEYLHLHCLCSSFSIYVCRPNPTLP